MIAWDKFLYFVEQELDSPVLASILKKTKTTSEAENTVTISCDNLGAKLFLENKKTVLEELLTSFLHKDMVVVLTVKEKPLKKADSALPLISYQNSFESSLIASGLNPNLTFENFAVSNSNQMGHAAGYSVASSPGKQYNPLFIYGGVGVGKTHLLNAIGHKLLEDKEDSKILYCTSEEFTNDLIDLIRKKNTGLFRNKYRTLDGLLIDDIQFVAGKNYIQEELYHTFNTLVRMGKQIVLSSDKPPKDITNLEERLKSRFSGGLMIDMQKPDFELRCAILLIKAKQRNILINIQAVKKIAEEIEDTRELEGMILNIYSKSLLSNKTDTITEDVVLNEIKNQKDTRINKTSPSDIIHSVCVFYDIKPITIKSSSRKGKIARARQIIMYLLRNVLNMKYEEIAFFLKRKDHTTILHGVDKIQNEIMNNDRFNSEINRIINSF